MHFKAVAGRLQLHSLLPLSWIPGTPTMPRPNGAQLPSAIIAIAPDRSHRPPAPPTAPNHRSPPACLALEMSGAEGCKLPAEGCHWRPQSAHSSLGLTRKKTIFKLQNLKKKLNLKSFLEILRNYEIVKVDINWFISIKVKKKYTKIF